MFVQLSAFVVLVFYNFDAINTQEKCRFKRRDFPQIYHYLSTILILSVELHCKNHCIQFIKNLNYCGETGSMRTTADPNFGL